MLRGCGIISRSIIGLVRHTICGAISSPSVGGQQTITVPPCVTFEKASRSPLHVQLYDALREAILDATMPRGARLPSTRALAKRLRVSRSTVVEAFRQLQVEGYVESKVGSGTRVSWALPEEALRARACAREARQVASGTMDKDRSLSRRGQLVASTSAMTSPAVGAPRAFRPGLPAFDEFPFRLWSEITGRMLRRPAASLLSYGPPAGYGPLRRAIAEHLSVSRGVKCEAEQIIVVSGSQQGLALAALMLLDRGEKAWVEDPGYAGAREVLQGGGAEIVPVPVDEEGLDVDSGVGEAPDARLACVTPSHQYPLGSVLSLGRRLKLLEWARSAEAWIVEDDYDSEYRYSGRPLASLQGLDEANRVIYVGTFSKVLFPALRIGYLVAPPDLVDAFVSARLLVDRHSPTLEQAVLADFIVEGHFERHLRRMRLLYAQRQQILVESIGKKLSGVLDVSPAETGLHLVSTLPREANDADVSRRAAAVGVEAPPLSAFSPTSRSAGGLILGYAPFGEPDIVAGVDRLEEVLA